MVEHREAILEQLHAVQVQRRRLRRRRLTRQHTWTGKSNAKFFYHRICTKFGDNIIHELKQTNGHTERGPADKANIFADAGFPIMNYNNVDRKSIDEYVERFKNGWAKPDLSGMDNRITETEVEAAIRKCKRGKAGGPDKLGNNWYKDHSKALTPLLTTLYNRWIEEGKFPARFQQGYIFSIKKKGDSSEPLTYRLIDLLNSEIHTAINLFEAAKHMCKTDYALSDAQALLLDFAKSYDTPNRHFLLPVLRAKGFPPNFCRTVEVTHSNTTATFLANGNPSLVPVNRAIRQGCPLAPLLLILAVDLLYDELEATADACGIMFHGQDGYFRLHVSGYADDTTIYIKHRNLQTEVIAAVSRFSESSGLQVNIDKSIAIPLGELKPRSNFGYDGSMPIAAQLETRYLGHWVGNENTTTAAWKKAFSALTVRLALAMEKTNSIVQRADIANPIIIPKLLYIAQHAWPTIAIVREAEIRLKTFLWHSSFALPQGRVKGWINAGALELPRNEGGLSIPNIGVELHALSAQTVGAWALESSRIVRLVGDVLRSRHGVKWPLITPVWRGQAPVNIRASMWINGSNWVARSLPPIFAEAIISNQIALLAKCQRRHGVTARWINGELVRDLRSILDAVQSSARSLDEGFGHFNAESVLQLQMRDLPLLTL
ncbi:unnamed protein product [Phytophthora fragariaefolia]|uniref:Unnamed protein product n=1 Tax=Phytophthora fragariaefolia TaxID=1490495 RepID=A0A9W7D0T1_9STRA|nr:unnamed protein product [Phytophthora fragariaefolia]